MSFLSNFFDNLCHIISLSKFKKEIMCQQFSEIICKSHIFESLFAHFLLNNPKKKIKITISVFLYTKSWVDKMGFICNENHLEIFPHCWMLAFPCQIIHHIITKWMLSTPITFSKPHPVIKWTNKVIYIWFAETEFPEISHG